MKIETELAPEGGSKEAPRTDFVSNKRLSQSARIVNPPFQNERYDHSIAIPINA